MGVAISRSVHSLTIEDYDRWPRTLIENILKSTWNKNLTSCFVRTQRCDPVFVFQLRNPFEFGSFDLVERDIIFKIKKIIFLAPTPTNGVYDRNFPYA
jgi:hypothetical protein